MRHLNLHRYCLYLWTQFTLYGEKNKIEITARRSPRVIYTRLMKWKESNTGICWCLWNNLFRFFYCLQMKNFVLSHNSFNFQFFSLLIYRFSNAVHKKERQGKEKTGQERNYGSIYGSLVLMLMVYCIYGWTSSPVDTWTMSLLPGNI